MPAQMFDVKIENLDKVVQDLIQMATDYRKIVVREFGDLGEFVRICCKVELADVRYMGELERSFVVEVRKAELETRVYPTARHAMFVRMGTRPHWAPIGPLKRWAAVKLGDSRLAYPVQRSIAEHGTSMYQQRKRGDKANPWPERVVKRADFQRALQKTSEEIGTKIVAEIFT